MEHYTWNILIAHLQLFLTPGLFFSIYIQSHLSWTGFQFKVFHAIICCCLVLPMGLCSVMNDDTIFLYASLVLGSSAEVGYCISNQSLGLPLRDTLNLLTTSLKSLPCDILYHLPVALEVNI